MAGYSGTPLTSKLGIKSTSRVHPIHPPDDYAAILGPLPDGARIDPALSGATDVIHLFTTRRADLEEQLTRLRDEMPEDAALWVSWPKKTSMLPTDLTEDAVRDAALPLGLVDVKVCAVTDVWSGLKLCIRKELRTTKHAHSAIQAAAPKELLTPKKAPAKRPASATTNKPPRAKKPR